MLTGVVVRSPLVFAALSVLLWWSAFVPQHSPFDAAYNALIARRRKRPPLSTAPAPRRFAQGLAAALMAAIAVALLTGHQFLAGGVAAVLFAAIAAILFGGFCFGSFAFHLLVGNAAFARRTLPWARKDAALRAEGGPDL